MDKVAWIDLKEREIETEPVSKEDLKRFLGSRGYAAKILYENVGEEVDPLSEENILIFSPGLLTGTPWPTGARYTVTAKSPQTQAYGYSNASGFFGPELRKAGYAALIFTNAASEPVYLFVEDDILEIKDATNLWGKKALDTEKHLKNKHENSRVSCIGPAAENLVKIASIVNDGGRTAARCGMGTVMGSKKLKAVVAKSEREVNFPEEFKDKAVEMARKAGKDEGSKLLRKWGTPMLIDPKNEIGDLPTKNHQEVQYINGEKINAEAVDEYVYKNTGCYSCPIRCSRLSRVESEEISCEIEGPEYETLNALGPMVWNDDLEILIYANKLCNEYGIDTISAGVLISFAMECHEAGILDSDEVDLSWGNPETIISLLQMITYREGLGDLLADGVKNAAEQIGPEAEKFALHVKGMELPRQEPRIAKAHGLGHATSNRGADHLYGLPTIDLTGNVKIAEEYFPECMPEILEVTNEKYKPEMLEFTQEYNAISDALGVCKFSTTENFALLPRDLAEGVSQLNDWLDLDEKEILEAGERIINLERMYNYRHGLSRKDDLLPQRFTQEPATVFEVEEGKLTSEVSEEGLVIDIENMLSKYYELRGWNEKGIPTRDKLEELDLWEMVKEDFDL